MKERIKGVNIAAKKEYILKSIISVILRSVYLVIPFFYSYAVEALTDGNYNRAYFLAGLLLTFTVAYYLSEIFNERAFEILYKKIYTGLTKVCLDYTEKNSIYSLSRITLSEYSGIMTDHINALSEYYANIPMLVAKVIDFVVIFYFFFTTKAVVGVIALLASIGVYVYLYFGNKKVNLVNDEDKGMNAQRLGVIQEYFFGMKEVKGFRLFNSIHKRIGRSYDTYLNWHNKYGLWKTIVTKVALCGIEIVKISILIYGIWLASQGKMKIAAILLVYSYFDKLITNFTEILAFNDLLQNARVSIKRLYKLEEFSQEKRRKDNECVITKGVIDFNDVLYGNRQDPILRHFSCHIPSRSITVITGKTGAGKTGIIDLLLKLNRQHEGEILIDKVDINEYDDEVYFEELAAVRKNPTFFHLSIRDNLKIIEPDFEKVIDICKQLDIHDDIMKLPNGYDTVISESAANINGDIKYMLSIARVLLKNPKVLLFDETLNAFPKDVDLKLMDYFKKTKGKYNVVIISKEKHVIEAADQVIYMEKGENIASGKHDTIIFKNAKYKKYFDEL